MLRTYLKIAWRNLLKSKTFSLINLFGLATGLAAFLLIVLYVWDELRFDRFHARARDIYRVHADIRFGGSDLSVATTADPMGAALKQDYPQVQQFTRIYASNGAMLIRKDASFISEPNIAHVDSTFFDVFSFQKVAGDLHTALTQPNTAVLTASAARKYFGTTEVVGRSLELRRDQAPLYRVTAVIEDMPRNSHFRYDVLLSMQTAEYTFGQYLSHNFHTYLLLQPDADPGSLEARFPEYIDKYVLPQAKQFMDIKSMADFEKSGNKLNYSLMSLTDIHLSSGRFPELGVNGRREYVWIFSAVAIFILLLACINFMNLSTARSAGRAKEVGIRKVMGTRKSSLVTQFISESVLMVCLSMLLALGIVFLAMPWFNDLAAKELSLRDLLHPALIPFIVILPLLTGLMAGLYPAFFLSRFQPIRVLKGHTGRGFRKSSLRSALVVFQFATSIVLIVGTMVVYRQLGYIQTTSLGYDKEQLLYVETAGELRGQGQVFKQEVLKIPGVKAGALSNYLPVQPSSRSDNTFSKDAVMDARNSFNQQIWRVDEDYLPVMGMAMAKGRWFSRDFRGDSLSLVINESSAALLNWDDPIGKKLYTYDNGPENEAVVYTIIGVVKNFHFESLRDKVGPLAMRLGADNSGGIFRVKPQQLSSLLAQVEAVWKKMAPGMPFSYRFVDESFDAMYRAEQRVAKLGLSFAILAILIACLGLFGLVTYMAEQRTREIGVRKVLGASVSSIVGMMGKDFVRLILVAAAIAFPLAWYAMNRWLQDYAFRVQLSWWVFGVAGLVTLLIAFSTISLQALRAARRNPINALRAE
jgi:putative ABC transport system permease protein